MTINTNDYQTLKALYNSTSGKRWKNNTGWDFTSETPPDASEVNNWHGVTVVGSRVTETGATMTSIADLEKIPL
ncbi:MAG: hypothetical protein EBE86_015665 [Hormoscilla sp. GUM202]|nr:hypothetical protein [Hormoscilla sp. GUM202]